MAKAIDDHPRCHESGLADPAFTLRPRDISIDYLRATLTVMVVAHHSALAYTTFAHFNMAQYLESTAPVVNERHTIFLDYAENFNDVFFMSLMFFVSGLFVWPSLLCGGAMAFLKSRMLRLGIPFVALVPTLMPMAYYASWLITGSNEGFASYWLQNVTQGFTPGPLWFVWLLLLFDIVIAIVFLARQKRDIALMPKATLLERRPLLMAFIMFSACGFAYLPALKVFGFAGWSVFLVRPLYFQTSRFGLYLLWFMAGVWIGRGGTNRGLLARDGGLVRHWLLWVVGSVVAYTLLMTVPHSSIIMVGLSAPGRGALEAILWVLSCVASCFGFLAIFRGTVRRPHPWMNNLARCAYGIYLVHYLFVLWCQWLLLGQNLHAGVKFLITFIVALALSWATARVMLLVPAIRKVV
ncbi:acyltransferase [Pantoea sp. S62]|uniref:acyltransferase family protein n=1 Tax=Pantoea sp. S62 TaxID=2769342 RepID=UPI0019137CAC|nr:acyltransferase [Pantoea sp. S62]MBK5017240.1 acyltransferase [Pantoea sp. S62]